MAVDYITANPQQAEISKSDLADIVECGPSLLSSREAKLRIAEARAIAKRASENVRRGFCDDSHQPDAEIMEDWQEELHARIDDE